MKPTKKAQVLAPLLVSLLVPALGAATGCKKDEPPPPLPSATAPVVAAPVATPEPIQLEPEPEALPSASASVTPPKGTGTGSSIKKCCSALRQNAANAPEPNKTYMLQAAAACDAGAQVSGLMTMLRGVGLPAACK